MKGVKYDILHVELSSLQRKRLVIGGSLVHLERNDERKQS